MHLECAPHMIHVVHKSFSGMLNLVPSQWLSTVRKIEVDKAWIGGLNLALFKAALPSLSTVEVQLPIANETLEMGESWLVLARCETLDQKTRVDCRLSPSHDGSLDWVAAYLQWSNAANTSPAISLQARQPLHIWKEQEVFVVLVHVLDSDLNANADWDIGTPLRHGHERIDTDHERGSASKEDLFRALGNR